MKYVDDVLKKVKEILCSPDVPGVIGVWPAPTPPLSSQIQQLKIDREPVETDYQA